MVTGATKQELASSPVVIEAVISPLRRDIPAQTTAELIAEANSCLAAGAIALATEVGRPVANGSNTLPALGA